MSGPSYADTMRDLNSAYADTYDRSGGRCYICDKHAKEYLSIGAPICVDCADRYEIIPLAKKPASRNQGPLFEVDIESITIDEMPEVDDGIRMIAYTDGFFNQTWGKP